MATAEEYSGLPIEARLSRLDQIPGELELAISGKTDSELSVRPDAHNWAAKEIVCHLRDVEELFQIRFHTIVALDEPRIFVFGASANDLAPCGGPRYWRSCDPSRRQSGCAEVYTSAGVASPSPTGSPGLRATMTTTSPNSAERSKVGHEVSGVVTAQSNFGMQPTAFSRG